MTAKFDVFENTGKLLASVDEIEACPGDSVAIVNKFSAPIEVKFCRDDAAGETIECLAEYGPFPGEATTPALLIPHALGDFSCNAIHVTSGAEYPKIMIRKGDCTGG